MDQQKGCSISGSCWKKRPSLQISISWRHVRKNPIGRPVMEMNNCREKKVFCKNMILTDKMSNIELCVTIEHEQIVHVLAQKEGVNLEAKDTSPQREETCCRLSLYWLRFFLGCKIVPTLVLSSFTLKPKKLLLNGRVVLINNELPDILKDILTSTSEEAKNI
ncbi:hypothetical protein Tco_0465700 [Tanacetum coccineum]